MREEPQNGPESPQQRYNKAREQRSEKLRDNGPQQAKPRQFDPIGRYRDAADIPPRRWLYGKHYILGFVSATIADGGMGKTNLSIAEGIALATGRNILGIDVPEPQRVLC